MIRRKAAVFLSFVLVLLIFTSCSTKENGENFLNNTNDQTLLKICQGFHLIRYDMSNFSQDDIEKSSDISQTGMFIFFVDTYSNVEQFYDSNKQQYKIPITYYQDYINKYFDDYTLKPSEISYDVYDPDLEALIVEAFPSPNTGFPEISEKEATDADTIKLSVKYFDRYEDSNSETVLYTETITLKISGDNYKFVSSILTY